MHKGTRVSSPQDLQLLDPITTQHIDEALYAIQDSKALGLDGCNSFFFKKVWSFVRRDIYGVVQKFFCSGKMCPLINIACITLIPKTPNADRVGLLRSISCCFVLYKLIAKILAFKMIRVMSSVVDHAQIRFIPGR